MKWLFRIAVQRAIARGSGRFATISVVLGLLRLLQKVTGTGSRTLYTYKMKPGEILVVREEKLPR